MPPPSLPTDPDAAYALGAKAGADKSRIAGDCPYDHTSLALRTRWMDGFSSTRRTHGTAVLKAAEAQPAG